MIFACSKLGLSRWFLAMHLLTQSENNIRALELRRYLGVCHRTAWLVKHKLIEVMRLREDGRQLTGRAEIDDAYLGRKRSRGQLPDSADVGASAVAPLGNVCTSDRQLCIQKSSLTVSINSLHYTCLFNLHMRNDGCKRTV